MARVLTQLFACVCVATVLTLGIGLGYVWSTGKISRDKLLQMLAIVHDVDIRGLDRENQAAQPASASEQVSFEDIEKRRALESLYLETKTIAVGKGLQDIQLQRDLLAEDTDRLNRLKAAFDSSLKTLAEKAALEGIEKQRQIWTKIEPTLAKEQIMDMVAANETDEVVVVLSDMQVANQAKIIGEFDLTEEKERNAVDEILRKIRKGLPAATLIEEARRELQTK